MDASKDEMTVTEIISICSNYSAIRKIKNLCFPENKFDLPYGSTSYIINKLIKSLNLKGTKGPDGISAKLVKISGNVLDSHFANIANNDISLNKYSKHAKATTVIRWPITATAKTKGNTVNKEILINKKSFVHI